MTSNFFSPLSFVAVFGSGIRDPGSGMGKNQDPGSGINIPDLLHCLKLSAFISAALVKRPRCCEQASVFNRPVCEVLLNQQYFNGIGNYLRAEILFRAGVPPFQRNDHCCEC
jgi:hypothetical protein